MRSIFNVGRKTGPESPASSHPSIGLFEGHRHLYPVPVAFTFVGMGRTVIMRNSNPAGTMRMTQARTRFSETSSMRVAMERPPPHGGLDASQTQTSAQSARRLQTVQI